MKNYGTKSKMLLIRSITINSDNYDEKYIKIKLNSDEHLLLSKMLKPYEIIIVLKSVIQKYVMAWHKKLWVLMVLQMFLLKGMIIEFALGILVKMKP